jgi:phosphoribosylamine-glycine ligase
LHAGHCAADVEAVVRESIKQWLDLVIAGQDSFLAGGGADLLRDANIPAVGLSRKAAQLETSKIFAKRFFRRHNILTADFEEAESPVRVLDIVQRKFQDERAKALVIKADGPAEGKGVVVVHGLLEAAIAIQDMMVEWMTIRTFWK